MIGFIAKISTLPRLLLLVYQIGERFGLETKKTTNLGIIAGVAALVFGFNELPEVGWRVKRLWLLGFQRGERKKQNKKKEKGRNRTTGRTEEAEISNRGEELLYFTDSSVETKKGCSWYIGSVSSFESTCVLNWTNLGVECLLCNKKFLVKFRLQSCIYSRTWENQFFKLLDAEV
ncbi:uncharacterized protein LOC133711330 [Rosa rugosa]|uniref:uncharacterized protein LOC133711330 n=1 Tax=Rosa rugosa TaxID=74645 RepID=UPI002B40D5CE|nr:uncharacterized protein LOC133711330 [Rosa rugosa]